jgi:hypothetical protein
MVTRNLVIFDARDGKRQHFRFEVESYAGAGASSVTSLTFTPLGNFMLTL